MTKQTTKNKYKLYALNKDLHPKEMFLFRNGDFYEIYQDDADRILDLIDAPVIYESEGGANFHFTFFPTYLLEQLKTLLRNAGIQFTVAN